MKASIRYSLIICAISFNAFAMNAQLDFSGVWILDHSKSDAEFRDYEITCIITQTAKTFSVDQVLLTKDGQKSQMPSVTYNLDGKEVIKEEQGGKDKFSAKWETTEQKTLTIRYVRNMDGRDFGSITTYTLAENGQILTIKSSDLTGDSPMIQVYKKK